MDDKQIIIIYTHCGFHIYSVSVHQAHLYVLLKTPQVPSNLQYQHLLYIFFYIYIYVDSFSLSFLAMY